MPASIVGLVVVLAGALLGMAWTGALVVAAATFLAAVLLPPRQPRA